MTTSLVIAIEPDREQAARLSAIVRARLSAELVLADTVARALTALGDRVPDLILTPALLSTRDEAALSARLRELGAAAAHVQTVTVPRIGGTAVGAEEGGLFRRFRRSRPAPAATDGCEPDVFAQQVAEYLQRARAERPAVMAPAIDVPVIEEPVIEEPVIDAPATGAPMVAEEAIAEEAVVLAIAALPVIEQVTVRPVIEEIPAPAVLAVEELAAPLIVDELVTTPVTDAEEITVAPVMEVEQAVVAPVLVEEAVAPPVIVEEFVPSAAPIEAIEPPTIAHEVVVPMAAAPAAAEPQFSVEDLALTMWVADEPETAPIEAAVVPPAPADDDRFYIAAQDFSDVDISTLLEGLVLPDAEAAETEAPRAEPVARPPAPEPEPEPEVVLAPLPSRRKLPPPRPVPAKAPRRRVKPPVQDEWGLFDPEQCGFAALLAKLDAVTEDEEMSKRRGTQTRVISYN